MNYKINIFVLLLMSVSVLAPAQTDTAQEKSPSRSTLAISLGPSISYFQGRSSNNFETFDNKRLNVQANAFLGVISGRSNTSNAIGIFGTAGYTNENTFNELLRIQAIDSEYVVPGNYNTFYQIEAGMVVVNSLRLSTGFGRHQYSTSEGDEWLNYLSSTVGIIINLGSVNWNLDANFNYGRDFPVTVVRFSTGFMLVF
jgi:hypothetical protein